MEHASRGRRSGNKGVGARWRGRFRIFSARHCSRTKVSHAENSGMTTIFLTSSVSPTPPPADWGGRIRCAGRPREWSCGAVPPQERWHEGGWFLFFSLEVAPMSEGDSFAVGLGAIAGACVGRGRGCERILPSVVRTFGAATAVTENAGGEVESCEGEVVAARDWHGACLPGSAFWK